MYFSLTGKTKHVCETLANELNVDTEEITPVKPYPSENIEKINLKTIILSTKAVFHTKPKVNKLKKKIEDYDLVIIGGPVWANNVAPPLNTIITENSYENINVGFVLTVDSKHTYDNAFTDYRKKIIARGGTVVQEGAINVIGTSQEKITQEAMDFVDELKQFTQIDQLEKAVVT